MGKNKHHLNLKRMSFKHKNNKFLYYLKNYSLQCIPKFLYQNKLVSKLSYVNKLSDKEAEDLIKRVNYYNKKNDNFTINKEAKTLENISLKEGKKIYFFDFYAYHKYFNQSLKVNYAFGDVTEIPKQPAFVKSRPISSKNENSILLKWNKVRHFIYIKKHSIPFEKKINKAVFRGRVRSNLPNRIDFVLKYIDHPLVNAGDVNSKPYKPEWKVNRMTITEQLHYKFIISLEGNDVASNLKWIMSSNSVAVMCKPTFETWFMEGTLIPNYHYIEIKEDYSDLEEKINYYAKNTQETLEIIKNANAFAKQFTNKKKEDLISLLVIKKYFEDSKQIPKGN